MDHSHLFFCPRLPYSNHEWNCKARYSKSAFYSLMTQHTVTWQFNKDPELQFAERSRLNSESQLWRRVIQVKSSHSQLVSGQTWLSLITSCRLSHFHSGLFGGGKKNWLWSKIEVWTPHQKDSVAESPPTSDLSKHSYTSSSYPSCFQWSVETVPPV